MSTLVPSDCEWAVTQARGRSEGSQGCREDADDDLNDGLPSFFLHVLPVFLELLPDVPIFKSLRL